MSDPKKPRTVRVLAVTAAATIAGLLPAMGNPEFLWLHAPFYDFTLSFDDFVHWTILAAMGLTVSDLFIAVAASVPNEFGGIARLLIAAVFPRQFGLRTLIIGSLVAGVLFCANVRVHGVEGYLSVYDGEGNGMWGRCNKHGWPLKSYTTLEPIVTRRGDGTVTREPLGLQHSVSIEWRCMALNIVFCLAFVGISMSWIERRAGFVFSALFGLTRRFIRGRREHAGTR